MGFSVSCRLPQTPRTPTATAAHYFDDVFAARRKSIDATPKKLARRSSMPSDTSDLSARTPDTNEPTTSHSKASSIGYLDEDALKRMKEADDHLAHHVSNQLERIRSNDPTSRIHDEFEAQLDGT